MKRNHLIYLIFTFLATFPAIFSLLYHPFFTFHDETQIVNMYEFFKTIDLGQFPPRWGLDFHFNYGSPFLQFYYQTPYYIGYLFHSLGVSLVHTFKYLLILGFFVGSIGMYFLGLYISTPLWAFVAAVVYTYTPYRAVTSFVRGSLGESFSLALFPWILLFSLRLYQKPTLKRALVAGISWTLLVLTHQLATIFFLPLILLIGLIFAFYKRKLIYYLLVSLFTSFGLSAYYLIPTIIEKKYIVPGSPFNFYDHFPFLKQLIFSKWGYRASIWGIDDGLSFQIGILPLILVILVLPLSYFVLKSTLTKVMKITYLTIFASFLGTIFLMNIRSSFIWEAFNFAQLVQFPWRLLMITTFLIPTLFLFVSRIIPKRFSIQIALLILFIAPILTIGYFQPGEVYDRPDDYYLHRYLPNQAQEDQTSISQSYLEHTEDYVSLPINAKRPTQLPESKLTAVDPQTKIFIKESYPFNTIYQIEVINDDLLTFHTFSFPGWQVKLGDKLLKHQLNENGAILIPVTPGQHTLNIVFTESPIRKASNLLTLTTLTLLLFVSFQLYRQKHRN